MTDNSIVLAISDCYQLLKKANEDGTIKKLSSEQFRGVISCCQKLSSTSNALLPPALSDLADILLKTLSQCTLTFDSQLVGSTAFCLILNLIQEPHNISLLFSKTLISATTEMFHVKLSKTSELSITLGQPGLFKLCLCNGLLQLNDSFWKNENIKWDSLMFQKLFPLLESHCFQYSSITLLSFRCLHNWFKRVNKMSDKSSQRLPPELICRTMNIVLSNWENPMNGVKEQNSYIFEQLLITLQIVDDNVKFMKPEALLQVVLDEQSWMMKSKYFMLAALLPKCDSRRFLDENSEDIVTGLLSTLTYFHLVSAGAELYKVCLESLTLEQWEIIFLKSIINVLISTNILPKQNFFNYWILPTIKKYRPILNIILQSIIEYKDTHDIIFSVVCTLKIGRKEGFELMQWQYINNSIYLLNGLRHNDEIVRSQAFATICFSPKSHCVPYDDEFQLIKQFLTENISADNAALRQNVLQNFSIFLNRVRDNCLQILQLKEQRELNNNEYEALNKVMSFLEWVYYFICDNLEIGSNYQRKYTSLELYKILMNTFSNEEIIPTVVQRREHIKNDKQKVTQYANSIGKWNFTTKQSREILLYCISDSSSDIREAAGFLLMNYFKICESELTRFSDLYRKGIDLCSEMLFYYADSGALLIQVVTTFAYKYNGSAGLKALNLLTKDDKVSSSLLSLAFTQFSDLKTDLLKAASQGSPLHGILKSIARLILDKQSAEYNKLNEVERLKLITLLESAVQHLIKILSSKTKFSDYAPTFCEMGEAIESMVETSSINVEDSDACQLSPAYQLIVNCIWLNLKICCKLASGLVTSYSPVILGVSEVSRCLTIVTTVLKSVRHKGAVESAGLALSAIVKTITHPSHTILETNQETIYSVQQLIENVADESISRLSEQAMSTSTRGAGGVVLLHKLLANDARPGKPLVHKILNDLLDLITNRRGDVPQCLHVLSVLVQDSSLSQEMASYIHRAATECFYCLTSPHWSIRNSALQLFGSLVPKLIGQRKKQDDENTTSSCYHLAYEELYYHAAPLMTLLIEQLEEGANKSDIMSHSKLVPPLTLLSNLSVGLLTLINREKEVFIHGRIIEATHKLIASPIWHVRHLAAKANAWFCSLSKLADIIATRVWTISAYVRRQNNEITSENELHGFLMNLQFLIGRFMEEKSAIQCLRLQYEHVIKSLRELKNLKYLSNISFPCRALLSELSDYNNDLTAINQFNICTEIVSESINNPKLSVGLFGWANIEIKQIIKHISVYELLLGIELICDYNQTEFHRIIFQNLHHRLNDADVPKNLIYEIIVLLCKYVISKYNLNDCNDALNLLFILLEKNSIENYNNVNFEYFLETMNNETNYKKWSILLPVMCHLISVQKKFNYELFSDIIYQISKYSDCDNCDEEIRFHAAKSVTILASHIVKLPLQHYSVLNGIMWSSVIKLLQDESSIIRVEAGKLACFLKYGKFINILNPYISLNLMFKKEIILKILTLRHAIKHLWQIISCKNSEVNKLDLQLTNYGIINPFEIGTNNIYEENIKIIELSTITLLNLIEDEKDTKRILLEYEILPNFSNLRKHCFKLLTFNSYNQKNSVIMNNDWYLIAKKITNQSKIVQIVNKSTFDNETDMFRYRLQSWLEQIPLRL